MTPRTEYGSTNTLNFINPRSTSITMDPPFHPLYNPDPKPKPTTHNHTPPAPRVHPAYGPSPADGHNPPYPSARKYTGNGDYAEADIISAQLAIMREQHRLWQDSERVIQRGREVGGLNAPEPDLMDPLEEMLRENGVIPMPSPTGMGAGWDSGLCVQPGLGEGAEKRSGFCSGLVRFRRRAGKGLAKVFISLRRRARGLRKGRE